MPANQACICCEVGIRQSQLLMGGTKQLEVKNPAEGSRPDLCISMVGGK